MHRVSVQEIVSNHKDSGKFFEVEKIRTFALDYGERKMEAIVCLHGVPTSSFLYRKVLPSLAKKGHRAVCIDFPGFGFTDRPSDFNYSFIGYVEFLERALQFLEIKKIHLVVHDMGGPIGFAFAARNKNKIKSLTILNTWIDVVNFTKPWFMQTLETPVIGEAELKLITHKTWAFMFDSIGVHNAAMIPEEEKEAYVDILKHADNGEAFLKIIRNYDNSPEYRDLCFSAVQNVPYPIQIVWGAEDPSLSMKRYGKEILNIAELDSVEPLYSKHLLQEEVWEALSVEIDEFIRKDRNI